MFELSNEHSVRCAIDCKHLLDVDAILLYLGDYTPVFYLCSLYDALPAAAIFRLHAQNTLIARNSGCHAIGTHDVYS